MDLTAALGTPSKRAPATSIWSSPGTRRPRGRCRSARRVPLRRRNRDGLLRRADAGRLSRSLLRKPAVYTCVVTQLSRSRWSNATTKLDVLLDGRKSRNAHTATALRLPRGNFRQIRLTCAGRFRLFESSTSARLATEKSAVSRPSFALNRLALRAGGGHEPVVRSGAVVLGVGTLDAPGLAVDRVGEAVGRRGRSRRTACDRQCRRDA
jgi:hypothetical protein